MLTPMYRIIPPLPATGPPDNPSARARQVEAEGAVVKPRGLVVGAVQLARGALCVAPLHRPGWEKR